MLTLFLFFRYQRSVEWAKELIRRQGKDESTVHRILEDYTKPLEHPCLEQNEDVPLHDEMNSEMVSKIESIADRTKLPVTNGDLGKSDDTEDPSKPSDRLQDGSGHDPLAADDFNKHLSEVTAPLSHIHCSQKDVLSQCGARDSGQRGGLLCAREGGPADEYVLVEEVVCDVSEKEDAPREKVSRRK